MCISVLPDVHGSAATGGFAGMFPDGGAAGAGGCLALAGRGRGFACTVTDLDEAETALREALRLSPENVQVWLGFGRCARQSW